MSRVRLSFFLSFCLALLLFLLISLNILRARADGGAPQLAYVAGGAKGIGIIDIARRQETGTIMLAESPHAVLLSTDGAALYIAQSKLGRVEVLVAKTGKIHCQVNLSGHPSLLALSLDASVLYAAGAGGSRVWALNPATCAILRTFETHEQVYGLAVAASTAANATPDTPNQLWIAGSTQLTVFEATGHLLGVLPLAGGPRSICIPGGFTAYVTTGVGSVVAVDLNTRRVERTLLSGGQYGPMDYDANTGEIYVPDRQHNVLDVLTPVAPGEVDAREPARSFRLNSEPRAVAITSDGQLGFVALANGQVVMLDIPGHSIVASIGVGGTPTFIITGLYPPAVATPPPGQETTTENSREGVLSVLLIAVLLVILGLGGVFWLLGRRSMKPRL